MQVSGHETSENSNLLGTWVNKGEKEKGRGVAPRPWLLSSVEVALAVRSLAVVAAVAVVASEAVAGSPVALPPQGLPLGVVSVSPGYAAGS